MIPTIRIPLDVTNPGQFFACCGVLELGARLWPGTAASFYSDEFFIEPRDASAGLRKLVEAFQRAELRLGDEPSKEVGDDDNGGLASPMSLGPPFNLTLDWWADKALKPWAGSMNAGLIFKAMRNAIDPGNTDPLNDLRVVNDPLDPSRGKQKTKKREPFYFDSRRGGNAKSLDVGFAPDAFNMTSAACPAVESLCIIGLQRFRPMPTDSRAAVGLPRRLHAEMMISCPRAMPARRTSKAILVSPSRGPSFCSQSMYMGPAMASSSIRRLGLGGIDLLL